MMNTCHNPTQAYTAVCLVGECNTAAGKAVRSNEWRNIQHAIHKEDGIWGTSTISTNHRSRGQKHRSRKSYMFHFTAYFFMECDVRFITCARRAPLLQQQQQHPKQQQQQLIAAEFNNSTAVVVGSRTRLTFAAVRVKREGAGDCR